MEVREAIRKRRSIRKYQDKPLTQDETARLTEALIQAPSAGNIQSRKFYFVTMPEAREQLVIAAMGQKLLADAPLVVVACTDAKIQARYGRRGTDLYAIQDVAASVMCMMLAATEMGLGTCWVGAFDEGKVINLLRIPSELRPVALVPVGHPAHTPMPTSRVSARDAVVEVD